MNTRRAILEGVVMVCAWFILPLLIQSSSNAGNNLNIAMLAIVMGTVVFGIRLQRFDNITPLFPYRLRHVIVFWAVLFATILALYAVIHPYTFSALASAFVLLPGIVVSSVTLVMTGMLRQVMTIWRTLHRDHLLWQMATSHLVLVLSMLFVFAAFLILITTSAFSIASGSPADLFAWMLNMAATLLVATIMAMIALIIVTLPTALVSYAYASRITDALHELTVASDALREGDYLARVRVSRTDEIGKLQSNFNQMASRLFKTRNVLRRDRDMVTRLLQSRRELFAGISHELRTPIATLHSYLETTRMRSDLSLPVDIREDLDIIQKETAKLQSLINDMFTLASTGVNQLDLQMQSIDLIPVLQRLVEHTAGNLWHRSRIELLHDLPAIPLIATIDTRRFEQIIHHLLQYAARQTSPGGIIMLSATVCEHKITIEIKDTGLPFSEDQLQSMWHQFTADGPGLPLVKELTAAMGGTVHASNIDPQGHCFQVCIPRHHEI